MPMRRMWRKPDITDSWKSGSNAHGDSVWCMYGCTHPHFPHFEIAGVYAVGSVMACVKGASNAGMSDG